MDLEHKVGDKESKGFMRKAFTLGYKSVVTTTATALSMPFVGLTGVFIGGGLALGTLAGGLIKRIKDKSKLIYEIVNDTITNYATINTIIYPITKLWDLTSPLIPGTGLLNAAGKVAYALTAYNATFVAMYDGAKSWINRYLIPDVKGIWSDIKDNFYNKYTRIMALGAVGYTALALGIPEILYAAGHKIANFAPVAFLIGASNAYYPFKAKKTEDQGLNPIHLVRYGIINPTVNLV
ncbi:MAG: hypothetical protein HY929_05480, partial [Euryarchaeota archaeon]|nr:hypothetical protein [Euryarchaeota archaeon]